MNQSVELSSRLHQRKACIGIQLPKITTPKSVDVTLAKFKPQLKSIRQTIAFPFLKNRNNVGNNNNLETENPIKGIVSCVKSKGNGDSDELPQNELEVLASEILKSIHIHVADNFGLVERLRLIELNFSLLSVQAQTILKYEPSLYNKFKKEQLSSFKLTPNQMRLCLERNQHLGRLQKTLKIFETRQSNAFWRKNQARSFLVHQANETHQVASFWQNQTHSDFFD